MTFSLPRLIGVLALPFLAACGPEPVVEQAPTHIAGYEAVSDNGYEIAAVQPNYLIPEHRRAQVDYSAGDAPGTIVVDVYARRLYWVEPDGKATRYAIAVGREGTSFRGEGYIGRKAEWPSWTPTANMIRTQPDMYAKHAGGMKGGLENPLGSRALYLYRDGRDTMFRIHGTVDNGSVGLATSAGCIRLYNQDVMDLYKKAKSGTKVKVRTLAESLAVEGPQMEDAWGRALPETPENIAQKEADLIAIAEAEAVKAAAEAEAAEKAAKADAKRLKRCARKGIEAVDCPLPEGAAPVAAALPEVGAELAPADEVIAEAAAEIAAVATNG